MRKNDTLDLVKRLTGQDNIITVPRLFCEFMGSLEGGAFLNQLIFWSDKGKDGWFYKSYKEWYAETMVNEYQVRKAVKLCEERGFLVTKLKRANGSPTLHYYLLTEKFLESILSFERNEPFISQNPTCDIEDSLTDDKEQMIKTEDTPSAKQKGGAGKKEKQPVHPQTVPIMEAYIAALGYTPAMYGKEANYAKVIAEAGYTPEQVVAAFTKKKQDTPYYRDGANHLSLAKLVDEMPAFAQYEAGGGKATQMSDAKRAALLTRAKNAQASIRTATVTKSRINPQWEEDIANAKAAGVL